MLCLQPLLMVSKMRHMDVIRENHILKETLGVGREQEGKWRFG